MKKWQYITVGILITGAIIYFIGPKLSNDPINSDFPKVKVNQLGDLEAYIKKQEATHNIKANNESQLIWANDSVKQQTEWCLLYLHGFSASPMEGDPTHKQFAQTLGMNLYIPRLAEHGLISDDPLLNMTPKNLYESAKESLAIAHLLGKKVIIMGCSTGATLSLKLASDFPELVDGQILYSPNVAINVPGTELLTGPWGLQIARAVFGGKYRTTNPNPDDDECLYWNCTYRLEAVVRLQQLIEQTMTKEVFAKVKCPTFLGYYYKDEEHQDPTVRVDAALEMFGQLGTAQEQKRKIAFDAGVHVIQYGEYSKAQPDVLYQSLVFAEDILNINGLK